MIFLIYYYNTHMNIGLPGTGIGGLFYFFSALVMLGIEITRIIRRKKDSRKSQIARRVIPMLTGIIITMLLLDWAVSMVIASIHASLSSGAARQTSYQIFTWQPIFLSMLTLGIIVFSVQVLKLLVRRPS